MLGDNRVLHGARRNGSDERRTVITIWYHPHYEEQVGRALTPLSLPPSLSRALSLSLSLSLSEQLVSSSLCVHPSVRACINSLTGLRRL